MKILYVSNIVNYVQTLNQFPVLSIHFSFSAISKAKKKRQDDEH